MALIVLIGFWIALASSAATTLTPNVVDLGYARYEGLRNTSLGLITYFGLPFAQAPTGDLRWRAPQPIDAPGVTLSDSIINANVLGTQCPQFLPTWYLDTIVGSLDFASPYPPQQISEDCLHLDVIVPNQPKFSSLPVVVQMHGGGYTLGSSVTFDGSQFTAVANGSLIFVQIQYRLGPYGFLSSGEIRRNGTANAGLLDQRAALDWVQRHVSAFGGDPERVTIWGGSAGGGSVTSQLILHGGDSAPPFRAAIPEYPWWQPFHDEAVLEAQYRDLLNATQCDDLACLRNLDSAALTNASQVIFNVGYAAGQYGIGDFYFGPSVDGVTIKDLPSNEFKQGHFAQVPLLIDHDAYEGVIFTDLSTTSSEVLTDLETLWPNARNSSAFFARLFQLYPAPDFSDAYLDDPIQVNYSALASPDSILQATAFYQRQTIFGDAFVNCPSYYVASAFVDAGLPVWKLRFAAGLEIHGATSSFLFDAPTAQMEPTYGAWMKDYWISFIVSGDPNASPMVQGKPQWPQYVSSDGMDASFQVLEFNQTDVGVNIDADVSARCDFLHGQSYKIRN